MLRFLRGFGWIVNIALVAMAADGIRLHLAGSTDLGRHALWGLFVSLAFLLLHTLPYFYLAGCAGRLREAARAEPREAPKAEMAVRLKARMFWPSLAAVALGLAVPIVGFAQMAQAAPRFLHGALVLALVVVHVFVWARHLMTLDIVGRLLVSLSRMERNEP